MLKQDDYVKGKLVEMGWRFGMSYESAAGHIACQMIMMTLCNRVRAGWGSWLQIIDRIPQHMAENEIPPLVHPSIHDPVFVKCLQAVDGIFDGHVNDLTKGALYWADLAKLERPWFKEKIVQGKKHVNISDTGASGEPAGIELVEAPAHMRVACVNGLSFWN